MSDGDRRPWSSDIFKYWVVDHARRVLEIHKRNGEVVSEAFTPVDGGDEHVTKSVFDWESWLVYSFTSRGHLIVSQGFNPHSRPPFHGRPSVYLDQNMWRVVADALFDAGRVADPATLAAAQRLILLASDGGIVLPLSTGHMVETGGLNGDRRYEVGLAMAALSAGWQIRHPMDLWQEEAAEGIRSHLGMPAGTYWPEPISTVPGSMWASEDGAGLTADASDYDRLLAMLTAPNVVLSVLIDPERIERAAGSKWVEHHARITAQHAEVRGSRDQRRSLARRRFFNENINYYVSAYRRLTGSFDSCSFSDRELKRLLSSSRMAGLLAELFVSRFIDHKSKWARNDLIDMIHLSSAAGYADYVAAEARTGSQLRGVQRSLGRPETVFTTLVDLVAALNHDGVKAVADKSKASQA